MNRGGEPAKIALGLLKLTVPLANKLLGRLWWCLAHNQPWDDNADWPHRTEHPNPVAA
ncbi:MAG: hypothetical protein WCE29_23190 [Mycobacterium sp.]